MTKRITESRLRSLIREELGGDDEIGPTYFPDQGTTDSFDYAEVKDPSTPTSALKDLMREPLDFTDSPDSVGSFDPVAAC